MLMHASTGHCMNLPETESACTQMRNYCSLQQYLLNMLGSVCTSIKHDIQLVRNSHSRASLSVGVRVRGTEIISNRNERGSQGLILLPSSGSSSRVFATGSLPRSSPSQPANGATSSGIASTSSCPAPYMGASENRGPYHSTLNSRILIIRTPK